MESKSAKTGPAISLPKGGGALTGIGEKFSPDLFTGTGNYSIPIELPPGRNGFQPQLSLVYSTGNGNSPFGLGWALGIPGVTRKSSKGVPLYHDERDVFILSGLEDLVPVPVDEKKTRYRPRTETGFARILHHHDRERGRDYWEVRSRDGTLSHYGTPRPEDAADDWIDPATVIDPANHSRRSAWKLTETRDTFGNRIEFDYIRDAQREDGPHRWDQVYLSNIRYVDYGDPATPSFLVQVKFHYAPRPDPFSEYRSGFEVRTVQRCTGIEICTGAGTEKRVRTYHLTYLDDPTLATPPDQLPANGVSLLAAVLVEGHDDAGGRSQKMPPLRFHYGAFVPKERTFEAVKGHELPPVSLASEHHELVDLFGNGLPDIIEMNGQVRYWRNLGNGRFDRPRTMGAAPAGINLSDVGVQLIDADGDGRADLVDSRAELTGYYSLNFQGEWERFHRWERAPSFPLEDPEVMLVDLDGDGVTDVLRSGTSFECYFNHPLLGWQEDATRRVARRRLEDFPNVNFSDPRVKWADMTGDGLTDIVLVHTGRVDYWPSIGRGDFAPRVTMRNSPRFPYGYAPQRILMGDVDGDGLADLIYVDDHKVTLWLNRGGNSWSDAIEILGTPGVTDMDAVRLVDLLGTGVSGVLWSRNATMLPSNQMFFLDFTGGRKPYLLEQIDNGMGAITNIGYAPSTKFYCEDLGTTEAWKTPLPFPVQVVARVESIDHFSKGKLTTEYRYHHGYWDGAEREFRGFGRVDQRDTEVIGDYNAPGLDRQGRDFQQVEPGHFSPPTETRSWFHLGPVGEEFGDWEQIDFSGEYWAGDPQALGGLNDLEAAFEVLPKRRAQRDAVRALRGRILRTELYARDESSCADRPYTVTERAHALRTEALPDAANDRPAVFFPHQVAERTTQWERGDDPMTQLAFTGDYDAYGLPGLQLSLAVPRGREYRQPATSAETFLATRTVTVYAQSNDEDHYIVDRVAHRTTCEIPNDGRPPEAAAPQPSALELWQRVKDGGVEHQVIGQTLNYYDGDPLEGLPLGEMGPHGALTRAEQLVLTEALLHAGYRSEGEVSSPPEAPPYLDRSGGAIAWTPDYPQAFRDHISRLTDPPPNGTPVLGGYVFRTGGGITEQGYFAVTVQRDYGSRGLVTAERDALGNETRIEYDGYEFLPSRVIDPIGLETKAMYDDRVLQPNLVTDPNGNETEYRYTPLGLLESIAVLGKPGQNQGDTSDRPGTRFEYAFEAFLASGGQQPIHTHTTRRTHHVNETDVPLPDRDQVIETREYSDGFGRLLQTRTLAEDVRFGSHEFGNDVLPADQGQNTTAVGRVREQHEPPNVVVSGWQTYDNKGRVVEKYEPFFSKGWGYAPPVDSQRGQKATLFYDPRGRVVRTLNPDGSEQLTVFGVPSDITEPQHYQPSPWESYAYDTNDNAGRTPGADPDAAAYASHHDTPASVVVDALGRTVEQVERNGPDPETDWYKTRQQYDIRGNLLEVWDQLGRLAFQHVYDLADRQLRTEQLDAGVRRSVFNAAGDVIEQRDSKGALILHAHDALRRPAHLWARDNAGAMAMDPKLAAADALFRIPGVIHSRPAVTLRERIVYGDAADAQLSEADAKSRNLLGKPYAHYDEAGLLRFEAYDFKGNVTEKERQVIADAAILSAFEGAASNNWNVDAFRIDWQPPAGIGFDEHAKTLLDASATYRTSQRYDALSRIKWVDYPADVTGARKRLDPTYNRAGGLERVSLDGVTFVERIAYNAKGQRTLIAYGDRDPAEPGPRVMTRHAYDPKTFRLARLRTEKYASPSDFTYAPAGGTLQDPLQDIAYDYDLAGNIIALHDVTPGSGPPIQPDRLDRSFGYDPLYRLISATGRECDTPPPSAPWDSSPRCQDVTDTRLYQQEYGYDPAGNLTRLAHQLVGGNGGTVPTRHYDLVPGTNRLEAMRVGSTRYLYQYDSAGNLSKENTERRFEWDHSNRMRAFRVQTQGAEPSKHAHYLYDAGGQRVKKLVRKQGGRVEVTVNIDGVFEYHRLVDGSSTNEHNSLHVLDNESRIATLRVGTDPDDGTPAVKFHFGDHLGSSTLVIDQDGGWVNREEYTPYGETSFGSFARKRYRFTGKERDEESGLSYHGARYYASWLGRWLSCDPILARSQKNNPKGAAASSRAKQTDCRLLSPYEYVGGSPLSAVDPTGKSDVPAEHLRELGQLGCEPFCHPSVEWLEQHMVPPTSSRSQAPELWNDPRGYDSKRSERILTPTQLRREWIKAGDRAKSVGGNIAVLISLGLRSYARRFDREGVFRGDYKPLTLTNPGLVDALSFAVGDVAWSGVAGYASASGQSVGPGAVVYGSPWFGKAPVGMQLEIRMNAPEPARTGPTKPMVYDPGSGRYELVPPGLGSYRGRPIGESLVK